MLGRAVFLAFVLLLLASCAAHGPKYPPDHSNPVYTVAVLPFYNATNDVEGPRMLREGFFKRAGNRHYSLMPLKETDRLLMDLLGITLGSQLELTDAGTIGSALGVDGVVYGYVLNFEDITAGIYNVKRVRAGFKLVDTRTGAVVWSRGLGVKSVIAGGDAGAGVALFKELKGDPLDDFTAIQGIEGIDGLGEWRIIRAGATKKAEEAAAIAIGEKLLTKVLGLHLRLESDSMLEMVMHGFPSGPGAPNARPMRAAPYVP